MMMITMQFGHFLEQLRSDPTLTGDHHVIRVERYGSKPSFLVIDFEFLMGIVEASDFLQSVNQHAHLADAIVSAFHGVGFKRKNKEKKRELLPTEDRQAKKETKQ